MCMLQVVLSIGKIYIYILLCRHTSISIYNSILIYHIYTYIYFYRKRVDGELAVSRAFGDFDYKKRRDLEPKHQKVSCYPDIRVMERNIEEDEVLILACDGLWDVMSSSQAVRLAINIHTQGRGQGKGQGEDNKRPDARKVAEELINNALNKGEYIMWI